MSHLVRGKFPIESGTWRLPLLHHVGLPTAYLFNTLLMLPQQPS